MEISAYPQLAPWLFRCLRLDHLHPRSGNGFFEARREVLAVHARGGNRAEPRVLMRQCLDCRALPSAHWLLGAAVNLLQEVERCFARGELDQRRRLLSNSSARRIGQ
jgi:hypothetical protein